MLNPDADIWFSDINERALELCRVNYARIVPGAERDAACGKIIRSDGFDGFAGDRFDAIVTNPPIRTGKANLYRLYRESREHLAAGGALYLVIQKKQGMKSTFDELTRLFGNCADIARKAGYHVLAAVARAPCD